MIQKTNSMIQECSYQVLLIASRENSSPVVLQQIYCSNVSSSIEYFLFLQKLIITIAKEKVLFGVASFSSDR